MFKRFVSAVMAGPVLAIHVFTAIKIESRKTRMAAKMAEMTGYFARA